MKKKNKKEITEQTVVTSVEKLQTGGGEKHAYILFLSGPLVGKLHHLEDGTTTFGRTQESDIQINDTRISRQHMSIDVDGETIILKDLGSTNGTYVNGKRVQNISLKDGDKIQISSATIIKFAYQDKLENIFHKELYRMAVVDPVTNVYNKRYFLERLNEEFSHARRRQIPLSLMMIDADHFKNVNDTFGHLAGDFALAHLADIVRNRIRNEDLLARYGGEEFVVILRNTDEKGAYQLAERIRIEAEKNPLLFEDNTIPLTLSIGVATLTDNNFETPEKYIQAADQQMYLSKESGRNKTSSEHKPATNS